MVINATDVLSVYKKTGGIIEDASADSAPTGVPSFADALKSYAGDAVKSLRSGETSSIESTTGKTDLPGVVQAINNAELVLQEVVTIRDKVIAAYQAITSSAI